MSETPNNPDQRIMTDKPEKDLKRIAAGKNLAECNEKEKRAGEPTTLGGEPEGDCGEEGMCNTTKIFLLLGAAGLGYYLYKTTGKKEEAVNNNIVQNNVEENTVSKLRSFKN